MEGAFRPVSSRFIGWIGCPFGASLLYAARENVSLVNGRSTRHVARAIGSEKHLWKRASPFTSEATDYLIPSGRAQGEKMTVCEWPRSLPPALSLSLSLPLASEKRRSMISSLFLPRNNGKLYSKFPIFQILLLHFFQIDFPRQKRDKFVFFFSFLYSIQWWEKRGIYSFDDLDYFAPLPILIQ